MFNITHPLNGNAYKGIRSPICPSPIMSRDTGLWMCLRFCENIHFLVLVSQINVNDGVTTKFDCMHISNKTQRILFHVVTFIAADGDTEGWKPFTLHC